jgi:hypothetical protein
VGAIGDFAADSTIVLIAGSCVGTRGVPTGDAIGAASRARISVGDSADQDVAVGAGRSLFCSAGGVEADVAAGGVDAGDEDA